MKTITTEKLPIKMWLEEIEDGAMAQIKNLANLPFAYCFNVYIRTNGEREFIFRRTKKEIRSKNKKTRKTI